MNEKEIEQKTCGTDGRQRGTERSQINKKELDEDENDNNEEEEMERRKGVPRSVLFL